MCIFHVHTIQMLLHIDHSAIPYAPFLVCQWSDRRYFFDLRIISVVGKVVEYIIKYFLY